MSDPFTAADVTLFAADPCLDVTVTKGASTWNRRALVSKDVQYTDMTSGVSSTVTALQLQPRVGLLVAGSTVTDGVTTWTLIKRLQDDGYSETWAVE